MTRYFLFLFMVNTFLAILLYYKGGRTGISPKFFLYTAGISLVLGVAFPFLMGFLEFYQVVMIFIVAISVVAFKISDKPELSLPEEMPSLQSDKPPAEETTYDEPIQPDEKMQSEEETTPEETIVWAEKTITELTADIKRTEDDITAAEETEILETEPEAPEEAEAETETETIESELAEEAPAEKIEQEMAEEVSAPEASGPAETVEKDAGATVALVPAPVIIDLVPVGERRYELVAVKLPDEDEQAENEADETELKVEPEKTEESPEPDAGFEFSEAISAEVTIESLVDKGVAAKVLGQYEQAIQAFLAALEMHPPVDLIQILTIDISEMYIKTGNYRLAWVGLENLLQDYEGYIDSELRKEIYSKMKYMEILHGLLQKFNLLPAPLAEVPDIIRDTAEEMTRRWKQEVF